MFRTFQLNKIATGTAVAGLMLVMAGCSSSSNDTVEEVAEGTNIVSFAIEANSAQEIPANASTAVATGELTLDQTTGALSGSLTPDGVDAIAAHIHEAVAGSNGDVIIALEITEAGIVVPEGTVLAADQMESMLRGDYYVNIHSDAYPGGEIRDQITASNIDVILVNLSGDNEVPAVTSAGTGTGYVTLNTTSGEIQVRVRTSGIITPTASHIHTGAATENGAVILALVQDEAEVGNFAAELSTLDADGLASMLADGTYINVHSAENTGGELRGQVVR